MAPSKKQSGFMQFVNHWHYNHPKLSLLEAVSQCSGIWEKMTAQERQPFGVDLKKPPKALSKADKVQLELNERVEHMKRTIERLVNESKKSQDLAQTKFLFCAFNYFIKDPEGDVYVPAEFAACEYSLQKGIISVFSSLIDPGQLNLGLTRDAQHHSETTHSLPLPPKALGESNLAKLHSQMVRYLANKDAPAIVFTTTEMMPIVQSCLRFLACDGKGDSLLKILIFDIQYLFFVLKKEVLDAAGLPHDKINIHLTNAFFLKDFFEFTNDIACKYHEANDRSKYCAQSMVMRWAFTFSDYMCGDLGIPLEPGKHVPSTVNPNYRIHNADTCSVTLAGASSIESFHTLASFQSLRIDGANKNKSRISGISSRCSSASGSYVAANHEGFEEVEEFEGPAGHRYNSQANSQRRSLKELHDDSSSPFSSRCSLLDHKGSSSKIQEYPNIQRKDRKYGGECKEPAHARGFLKKLSDETSLKELPDDLSSPLSSRCSSAFSSYAATDHKGSSSKMEKYSCEGDRRRKYRKYSVKCSKQLPDDTFDFDD